MDTFESTDPNRKYHPRNSFASTDTYRILQRIARLYTEMEYLCASCTYSEIPIQ